MAVIWKGELVKLNVEGDIWWCGVVKFEEEIVKLNAKQYSLVYWGCDGGEGWEAQFPADVVMSYIRRGGKTLRLIETFFRVE